MQMSDQIDRPDANGIDATIEREILRPPNNYAYASRIPASIHDRI